MLAREGRIGSILNLAFWKEHANPAGVATVMSAFHELNGVPASGNGYTLRQILKETWGFDGFVVSDWGSVTELINHGFSADPAEAARTALTAGVDMEMVSRCYVDHVRALLDAGAVTRAQLDDAVARILRVKIRLGLFEQPYCDESRCRVLLDRTHLEQARRAAAADAILLFLGEEAVLEAGFTVVPRLAL